MRLPGTLSDSTLGDILGQLHRGSATGRLEIIEGGPRVFHHEISWLHGDITAIHSPHGPRIGEVLQRQPTTRRGRRTGEALLASGEISISELSDALREQLLARLEALFAIKEAQLRFHVPRPSLNDATAPLPLKKDEFLKGRPRARDLKSKEPSVKDQAWRAQSQKVEKRKKEQERHDLSILGLKLGASQAAMHEAFRRLARKHHPDSGRRRAPACEIASTAENIRFIRISQAYHRLTG
ncbi:MAG: J domain-containing protein [Polyangiaceae bacterium]|nr:J domain-containing protein [Polyangiaceae bacterium]